MSIDRPDRGELLLIRHPQVDLRFHGVCYGRSDVALSSAGRQQSLALASQLSRLPVKSIFHSGLQRTALLATELARLTGLTATREPVLAERDFGSWELQTWDAIYQQHGDEMMRMVSDPSGFRPGGGETTDELADRVWNWYRTLELPGVAVIVTHGGPIAACLGRQRELPVDRWMELVPACGELVWTELWRAPTALYQLKFVSAKN